MRGYAPRSVALAAAIVIAGTSALAAASAEADSPSALSPCAGDDAARLAFLTEKLDARRRYASNYYRGWLGFYTVGFGVSTYNAATEDDKGKRAVQALSAAKAVFGIGRMVYAPPGAKEGASGLLAEPLVNAEACAAEVGRAEERLRRNAHEAGRRFRWKSHVFNLALHVTGAVAVGEGFDQRKDAWVSAGIGAAVGEAVIWTFPWHAEADLTEYEERFPRSGVAVSPSLAWSIVPTSRGAALELRF